MASVPGLPPADAATLRIRLERERAARREAEVIAERGMSELWDRNQELRALAATAERWRLIEGRAARDLAAAQWLVASQYVPSELAAGMAPFVRTQRAAVYDEVACDEMREIIETRWRRATAQAGHLLTVDFVAEERHLVTDLALMIAVCDVQLTSAMAARHGGALTLEVLARGHAIRVGVPELGDACGRGAGASDGGDSTVADGAMEQTATDRVSYRMLAALGEVCDGIVEIELPEIAACGVPTAVLPGGPPLELITVG